MGDSIEVVEYSKQKLFDILEENSTASKELILGKNQLEYFHRYLTCEDIGAKTIVIEHDYIDRDFLEDFTGYYVGCFLDYPRKCTRLHFFSFEFQQADFDSFLAKFDAYIRVTLEESYLGFMVIKPLPQTIIGQTCLRTYRTRSEWEDKRVYPAVREYEVNLCGIDLRIESLAFLEQDGVVSSVATSVLWAAFQRTAVMFHHKMVSPVEITKIATTQFLITERPFPNKGLTLEQMIHVIQELNMEPYVIPVENDDDLLKNFIYSYLAYGIPIILLIDLYDTGAKPGNNYLGRHAVVVTGYRLKRDRKKAYPPDGPRLVSSNMTRIYVHDDQIGPFAKMKLKGEKIPIDIGVNNRIERITLETEWIDDKNHPGRIRAVPEIMLIPLYHKIRIPLENIIEIVGVYNCIIEAFIGNTGYKQIQVEKFEWDISLTSDNKLKKEIISQSGEKINKKEMLKKNMPLFIWRAKFLYENEQVMDLLFDATDIEQGPLFFGGIVYNRDLFSQIRDIITNYVDSNGCLKKQTVGKLILEWLKKQ